MRGSITVDSVTLDEFLSGKKRIIIPDYQRRYDWKESHTEKLVRDLYDNYEEFIDLLHDVDSNFEINEYFIGNLVFYNEENSKSSIEVVDGQQRITTLFILFVCLIHKIDKIKTDNEYLDRQKEVAINRLTGYMWEKDGLTDSIFYERPLLITKVIGEDQEHLNTVINPNELKVNNKSNHVKNYRKISSVLDELFMDVYNDKDDCLQAMINFIYAIHNKTLLLTINTSTQNMALTIFQTLNDSGMQLSPADILKAKLYRELAPVQRSRFIEDWNNYLRRIDDISQTIKISITEVYDLFLKHRQADKGVVDSKLVGIKKYYERNPGKLLQKFYLEGYIDKVLSIYERITTNYNKEKCVVYDKLLHVIMLHPYINARSTAIIYIIEYESATYFEKKVQIFLKNLIYLIYVKGFSGESQAVVDTLCMSLNEGIMNSIDGEVYMGIKPDMHTTNPTIEHNIKYEVKSTTSMLSKQQRNALLLLAYNTKGQNKLLPEGYQIEHILPKKWEANYNPSKQNKRIRRNTDEINLYVNCMANLTLFESKLNIKASNAYFKTKKGYYRTSDITMTKRMAQHQWDDWYIEDIEARRITMYNQLMEILLDYATANIRKRNSK